MEEIVGCGIHSGVGEGMWPKPALGPGMQRIVPDNDNPWLIKLRINHGEEGKMKVKIEKEGFLSLPEEYIEKYDLNRGKEIYIIPTEEGFAVFHPKANIRKVYIEPTTRCNLNCITCIRNVWNDEQADMEMKTFNAILEQLRELKHLKTVTLGGFGEPFYHPNILKIIESLKSLEVELTISTNGTLLNKFSQQLIDLEVDKITVSMDSVQSQKFSNIRKGASLRDVAENIKEIHQTKRQKKSNIPTIEIEFVLMYRNASEFDSLLKLARSIGVSSVLVTNLLPHTEEMCKDILYDRAFELPKRVGWPVSNRQFLEWGSVSLPNMQWGAQKNCRFVESKSLVIGQSGVVSPCYALMHSYTYFIFGRKKQVQRYVLGNIFESSISSIWKSEEYFKFRNKVRVFDFPSCVDCGLACDLAERNEDCWTNNPSCADCLWACNIIRCP